MITWFTSLNPIVQACIGTCFTWFVTALGAGVVFFFKTVHRKVLDSMLGFAAGVMIAASFWSLLNPAIKMIQEMGGIAWIPPLLGFLTGGFFLWIIDKILPHLHPGFPDSKVEGIKTHWQRSVLLVLAITLHNIPEGLAVGVAFGAVAVEGSTATLGAAIALTVGIGLQNFPEGTSVSVPLHREGFSRRKAFWYGQLSGIVEPVGGIIGAAAVIIMRPVLPYTLAFAAGAMIYVVVEELIPESRTQRHNDIATWGAMAGFAVMMTLDVALG